MYYENNIGYLGSNPGSFSDINTSEKHTKVYYATHKHDGTRDSYMDRSFISFSFGGKLIEDFNLIAVINSDRLNRQLVSNFNDITTSYDVLDGEFYWNTYYMNNQIDFILATDGMTQNQLDSFRNWFSPGKTRELILSEHPNRAIMARVMEPPTMEIIPFGEETTVLINGKEYQTKTTLYKGEINLSLTMAEPFWYSKVNLLAEQEGSEWIDAWSDANNNKVVTLKDKDALKVILEDRIPTLTMLRAPLFLGNDLIFKHDFEASLVGYAIVGTSQVGIIDIIQEIGPDLDLNSGDIAYLYYSGTAPEKPTIKFKATKGSFNETNTITFTCTDTQTLVLKKPRLYKEFDIAYDLLNGLVSDTNTVDELRELGRSQLSYVDLKYWFFQILEGYENEYTGFTKDKLLDALNLFLPTSEATIFSFNFQTGEMKGVLPHRKLLRAITNYNQLIDNNYTSLVDDYEDVSDMVASAPIILKDRNRPSDEGSIEYWSSDNPDYSYRITHTFNGVLKDLSIEYKNKYY